MNSKNNQLVSVIIPCYNSGKFLCRTLNSLLTQTHQNLQILCIDDGSTDNTLALLQQKAQEDARIEWLHKENGGVETALKSGADLLKGEFVLPVGHDDTLSANAVASALQAFENDSELDAVRLDLKFIFSDSSKNFVMNDRRVMNGKEALLETIGDWNIHTFCLWRRSIFSKIKEVDAKGAFNFDELATRYLYLNCRKIGFCDGIYNYYQHEQSVTKSVNVRRLQALTTDVLLRSMLQRSGLYKNVAGKFEKYALANVIGLGTMFFSINRTDIQEQKKGQNIIKTSFELVDKKKALAGQDIFKKILWSTILSSFRLFSSFLKIRSIYQLKKGSIFKRLPVYGTFIA